MTTTDCDRFREFSFLMGDENEPEEQILFTSGATTSYDANYCFDGKSSGPQIYDDEDDCDQEQSPETENETVLSLVEELQRFMEWLPQTPGFLNSRLDAEHNSQDEKAWGLLQYYQERPHLLEYTLEKELPRMEYNWIDAKSGEFIEDDKARIAVLLLEASLQEDPMLQILARSANQSLLADLIHYLSTSCGTESPLIRTQFHTAVQTRQVNLTIMPSNGTVLAKAVLDLNLPHPHRNFVCIGKVHVSAQFSPPHGSSAKSQSPPLFHYHVEAVEPCLDPRDPEQHSLLLEMARFIADLPSFVIEEEDCAAAPRKRHQLSEQQQQYLHNTRDVFLQRTQSAWKQMNSSAHKLWVRLPGGGGGPNTKITSTSQASATTTRAEDQDEDSSSSSFAEMAVVEETLPGQNLLDPQPLEEMVDQHANNALPEASSIKPLQPKSTDDDRSAEQHIASSEIESTNTSSQPLASSSHDDEAVPSKTGEDEPMTKKPGLPKSLLRIRDAQKATWKKQMSRLKNTAAVINQKHRQMQQRAEQGRLQQHQKQKDQQGQWNAQQRNAEQQQPKKAQVGSRNNIGTTAKLQSDRPEPSTTRVAKESPHKQFSKQNSFGPSANKWNSLLRSRFNRISKSAILSFSGDDEDQFDELVFEPKPEDDTVTITSTAASTDVDDFSVYDDKSCGGSQARTRSDSNGVSVSNASDIVDNNDTEMILQNTDVWLTKDNNGSNSSLSVDFVDSKNSSASSHLPKLTPKQPVVETKTDQNKRATTDGDKLLSPVVEDVWADTACGSTANSTGTRNASPLQENFFWRNQKSTPPSSSWRRTNSSRVQGFLKLMA